MKKTLFTGAMMLLAAATFAAGANLNDAKTWATPKVKSPSAGILEMQGPGQHRAKAARFKIDPNKKYRISGEVRKAPGANTKFFLAGFVLYDKDQKEIRTIDIRVISGTRTVLVEEAKAGATTVKVKNAVRWPKGGGNAIAFNAGPLPNRDLAPYKAAKKEGMNWIITLNAPLKKTYKAGTKVWVQASGAHFSIASVAQPGADWTKFSVDTKGVSTDRIVRGKFWPGTVYAEPMMMPNWNWSPAGRNFKVQVRNFKVEEVK